MSKSFNRDTSGDESRGPEGDATIERELENLLKNKATDYQAWQKLKVKYGNNPDLMQKILEAYKHKLQKIYKKARKFKELMFDKYSRMGLSYGEMVKKAMKYKRKYKFTDEEFDMFTLLALTDKSNAYATEISTTKMAKTLGYDAFLAASSKLDVPANELSVVEEIVTKYGETKALHAQVLLQSLTYQDCAPEALMGVFDEKKHNVYAHIHPIVAALFIPRIRLLDEQMLMANIGYIVHSKTKEMPVNTLPDFNLYWALVTDPNDAACTTMADPITDLKHRFNLQVQLWEAVLNLRQGKYYYDKTDGLIRFMSAIERCKNVIHDAPDLTYVKDEGTILRRLLSAFSLYPTFVSINRIWGMPGTIQTGLPQPMLGQFGYPQSPYEASGMGNVTRVPMITMRLPFTAATGQNAVSLEEALTQPQWFVENKTVVPKSMTIIHSNDVLFFYVGRRYQTINLAKMASPYNFTSLPMTVSGFESLNNFNVNAPRQMTISNELFQLRSVVLVEQATSHDGRPLIVGSSSMIISPVDPVTGTWDETIFKYDPVAPGYPYKDPTTGMYTRERPITLVPSESPFNGQGMSFERKVRCAGTIFLYAKLLSADCIPIAIQTQTTC
ncbi:MAG: P4B major core protein [Barrevirus sp.]|uniref:P4B major core protein n=1 Tax=Barrevirus sp. TaxID=2487763 RepID=A0A3G4ZQQ8_9VIRU|nr:MAG: P4B major core protein [Barrevirus sp.]